MKTGLSIEKCKGTSCTSEIVLRRNIQTSTLLSWNFLKIYLMDMTNLFNLKVCVRRIKTKKLKEKIQKNYMIVTNN